MTSFNAKRFRCTNALVRCARCLALPKILLFCVLAIRRRPPPISIPTSSTVLATRRITGGVILLSSKAAPRVAAAALVTVGNPGSEPTDTSSKDSQKPEYSALTGKLRLMLARGSRDVPTLWHADSTLNPKPKPKPKPNPIPES